MPKLTIILDYSPKAVVNFYSITEVQEFPCVKDLQNSPQHYFHGITLNHTVFLFYTAHHKLKKHNYSEEINSYIKSNFSHLLAEQKDILITYILPDSKLNLASVNYIKEREEFKNYTVSIVINLGRADIVYEQESRLPKNWYKGTSLDKYSEKFVDLVTLKQILETELGNDNVHLLYDDFSEAYINSQTSKTLQKYLGLDEKIEMPLCKLDLKSKQGRDLFDLIYWDYPILLMRNEFFQTVLQNIKRIEEDSSLSSKLDFSYNTSQEKRVNIIKEATKLGLYPFSENESSSAVISSNYQGLEESDIKIFISNFDKNLLEKLREHLKVFFRLLNPQQKLLVELLKDNNHSIIELEKPKARLSVLTLCYNHEKYIAECIKSVQAQKTTFPIKHIIVDHASTDKSQEVIERFTKKYNNIELFSCRSRLSSGENVEVLFKLADTEYVALCDGDDYFTDPFKLQKQVDLLEQNPKYGLCFHPVEVRYEDEPQRNYLYPPAALLPRGIRDFYYLADLFKRNLIQTNSVVYRWRFKEGLPDWFKPDLIPGDWYWHLLHAEKGKIGFINEVMSVYRRHKKSLYSINEYEGFQKHFTTYGMSELNTFNVINKHFSERYEDLVMQPVEHVFNSFLKLYLEKGDSTYLNQAVEKYPNFAKKFFNKINALQQANS